jgi:hypothetical protein
MFLYYAVYVEPEFSKFPHASLNNEAAIQAGVYSLPRHCIFSEIKIAGV